MARPKREGLDYFPLDANAGLDDEIELVEAEFGLEGFAIFIKLLQKIYKSNYYIMWTEKEKLQFSKRVNVDINRVNVIIMSCLKWGLFDQTLYDTYQILTSRGIQKRFLLAIDRRTSYEFYSEYLLLSENEVNAYKNLVIVNKTIDNADINPQSKVKESKVKESKEKVIVDGEIAAVDYISFFNNNFHMITQYEKQTLLSYEEDGIKAEVILIALQDAVAANVRDMRYVKKILTTWQEKNIKTMEDVNADKLEFQRNKSRDQSRKGKESKDNFNNYQQRSYNFDVLEKQLLGWENEGEKEDG